MKEGPTRREVLSNMVKAAGAVVLGGVLGGTEAQELKTQKPEQPFEHLPSGLRLEEKLPPVPEASKIALLDFLKNNPQGLLLNVFIPGNPRPEYNDALLIKDPENVRSMSAPFLTDFRPCITIVKEPKFFIREQLFATGPKPPETEIRKDIYGNSVEIVQTTTRKKKDDVLDDVTIQEVINIYFPVPLADKKFSTETPTPLNFEIPITGGKVEGLLYATAEVPKFEIDGYRIFGNTYHELYNDTDFIKKFKKPLHNAIQGIESLNNMMGGQTKFIRNIFIISTRWGKDDRTQMGGTVSHGMHDSVNFFDDELTIGNHPEMAGFHEAAHIMDVQLGVSEDPRFKSLFHALPSDFFKELNENAFLPGAGEGAGHSQDNEFEFLATLINSLTLKKWQKKCKQLGRDFLKNYGKSLSTLEQILKDYGGQAIPSGAPIFGIISERRLFIEDFLKKQ